MNCPKFTVSITRKIMQLSIVIGNILKKGNCKTFEMEKNSSSESNSSNSSSESSDGEGEGGNRDEDIHVASGVGYM